MRDKVLVTGGAGFIGSHLVDRLLELGQRTVAVDNLSTGRLENLGGALVQAGFEFIRADINDRIVLDRVASECHTIFHLAAAVGVKLIVEDPVHTIETNITGTEAVLKAALRYGCRVVVASTSEVYGKGTRVPFNEDDDVTLGPTTRSRWSYAASKMIDEFLALAYCQQYQLATIVVRLFNTIGPRQTGSYGMVVPRFVRQALRGQAITVFGDGTQSRCFCDVRDVVGALVSLAESERALGRVLNVGSQEEVTIRDLAALVVEMTSSASSVEYVPYSVAYAPGFEDMQRRVPDTARIGEVIGWAPRHSLRQTLETVIEHERGVVREEAASGGTGRGGGEVGHRSREAVESAG